MKLIYDVGGSKMTKNVPVPPEQQACYALSDDDILQLARWAVAIEEYYSQKKGSECPMDMEWAKDGRTGELFIVQARPETVQSLKTGSTLQCYHLKGQGDTLITGRAIGEKIATGRVHLSVTRHN